jgi:hypothetical protein
MKAAIALLRRTFAITGSAPAISDMASQRCRGVRVHGVVSSCCASLHPPLTFSKTDHTLMTWRTTAKKAVSKATHHPGETSCRYSGFHMTMQNLTQAYASSSEKANAPATPALPHRHRNDEPGRLIHVATSKTIKHISHTN